MFDKTYSALFFLLFYSIKYCNRVYLLKPYAKESKVSVPKLLLKYQHIRRIRIESQESNIKDWRSRHRRGGVGTVSIAAFSLIARSERNIGESQKAYMTRSAQWK